MAMNFHGYSWGSDEIWKQTSESQALKVEMGELEEVTPLHMHWGFSQYPKCPGTELYFLNTMDVASQRWRNHSGA